mmetsp:Transcript_5484/g.10861  ORF Transcript_5484/g.10861 Transcript_5484/m.10861 type:complete len:151 (-) Transcript_5484:1823-2275(-)
MEEDTTTTETRGGTETETAEIIEEDLISEKAEEETGTGIGIGEVLQRGGIERETEIGGIGIGKEMGTETELHLIILDVTPLLSRGEKGEDFEIEQTLPFLLLNHNLFRLPLLQLLLQASLLVLHPMAGVNEKEREGICLCREMEIETPKV